MKPARLARLHAATDREFGQTVTCYPRSGGGYVSDSIDSERSKVDFTAYFTKVPDQISASGKGAYSETNAQLRASAVTIKYDPAHVPYEIKEGDQIKVPEQEGEPELRVSKVNPFWMKRVVLLLVPLKK